MITQKRKTGDLGEAIAAKYLENKGFTVICRNYWKPYGEIDLVCTKQGVIHFVEVKTVSCEISIKAGEPATGVPRVTSEWNPAERINPHKLRRLEHVVAAYIEERQVREDWQIDAALVYLDRQTKRAKVEILEGVR